MSFLLEGKRKKRQGMAWRSLSTASQPPGGSGKDQRLLQRQTTTTTSIGNRGRHRQDMVMLQKHKPKTTTTNTTANAKEVMATQLQKKTVQPVTPQQQLSDAYTMEEVLKDLQVLEAQQRESRRLLDAARETKQRKEQQRVTAERQLGDLKYKDGQIRQELERHREILAAGQRQLATARNESNQADIDLRNFNKKLARVLATKRVLLAYQEKQKGVIATLESQIEKLHSCRETEDDRIRQQEEHLQSLEKQVEQLRHQVHVEKHEQHDLASRTAQLRAAVSKLELDRDSLRTDVATTEDKHEELVVSLQELEYKHSQALEELESEKATKLALVASLSTNVKQAAKSRDNAEKSLLEAWNRHEEICKLHNLATSPPNTRPPLEMAVLEELLEKENQATVVEETSKVELIWRLLKNKSEMVRIEKEASALQEEISKKTLRMAEQQETLAALDENESRQNKQLAQAEKRVQELREKYEAIQSEQQGKSMQAKERCVEIRQQQSTIEASLKDARRRCGEKKESLNVRQDSRQSLAIEGNAKVKQLQESISSLTKELDAMTKERELRADYASDEKYKTKTDKLLEDHPSLEAFEITYEADLTSKQQAKRDLASLIKACKSRVESAKKAQQHLEEAARQNDEERHAMQRQSKEEQERRNEARRRRESRLEAEKEEKQSTKSHRLDKKERSGQDGWKERVEANRRKDKTTLSKGNVSKEQKPNRRKDNSPHSEAQNATVRVDKNRDKSEHEKSTLQEATSSGKGLSTLPGGDDEAKTVTATDASQSPVTKLATKNPVLEQTVVGKDYRVDLGSQLEMGEDFGIASFSAAKPRNLLTVFSQSNTVDESNEALPSSQKKVRWQEDEKKLVAKKDAAKKGVVSKKEHSKVKKTFSGNSIVKSSKSATSRTDRKLATTKSKKTSRNDKDRPHKERHSFGDSRGRRAHVGGDSLASLDGDRRKQPKASSSRNASKEPKDRQKQPKTSTARNASKELKRTFRDGESSKSQTKGAASSMTEKVSTKRSKESAFSAKEQRQHKRRRNGPTATLHKSGSSKSAGAKSFGEDVAFSF